MLFLQVGLAGTEDPFHGGTAGNLSLFVKLRCFARGSYLFVPQK